MTKFKVITTYVYAFNVTRHALNAQDIYVAEKMRMTKAWQVGPDNLETVGVKWGGLAPQRRSSGRSERLRRSRHGEVLTVRVNKGGPDGEDLIKGGLARRSRANSKRPRGGLGL